MHLMNSISVFALLAHCVAEPKKFNKVLWETSALKKVGNARQNQILVQEVFLFILQLSWENGLVKIKQTFSQQHIKLTLYTLMLATTILVQANGVASPQWQV